MVYPCRRRQYRLGVDLLMIAELLKSVRLKHGDACSASSLKVAVSRSLMH